MDSTFKNYFKRNQKGIISNIMALFGAVDEDLDGVDTAIDSLDERVKNLEHSASGLTLTVDMDTGNLMYE